jgi:hypothetical protein
MAGLFPAGVGLGGQLDTQIGPVTQPGFVGLCSAL